MKSEFYVLLIVYVNHVICQNFMGFSIRDIAELTQMGTQLASQTLNSNRELLSKPGRPEVKPVDLNASPSDIFSQGITNILEPARENFMKAFQPQGTGPPIQPRPSAAGVQTVASPSNEIPNEFSSASLFRSPTLSRGSDSYGPSYGGGYGPSSQGNSGGSSIFSLANSLLRGSAAAINPRGQQYAQNQDGTQNVLPNIKQLLPGADENFGIRMGEGCLPFIGEFMRAAYGNCVRDADKRTWDVWGKELTNALTTGKIDLLAASKETCRRGAEREQCGQLRKAVSDCDILGSIQIGMNMQRSFQRCEEVTGIFDQNPRTMLGQMNGLINGEMAQGFINNFLG